MAEHNYQNIAQNVATSPQFNSREFSLPNNEFVTCGVAWDFFDKKIDLDVTVVVLDSYSFEMDAAYYNQTNILNNSIIHSGDNQSGVGDGDDEQIKINLKKLPTRAHALYFLVNAYSGGSFQDVETGSFTLYDGNNKSIYRYGLGTAFASTALLIGVLYRQQTTFVTQHSDTICQWKFRIIAAKTNGKNFVECRAVIESNLTGVFDECIIMERPKDRHKTYNLEKGEEYVMDKSIQKITVGLGWDPAEDGASIDVDGSIILFANTADLKFIETVDFGFPEYKKCILHHGDNLTGLGEGDDEQIDILFDKMDAGIGVIVVVINIYSGAESFSEIRNCFARLVDDNNVELCRFNLSDNYDTTAMVMCCIDKKKNGCWAMEALGHGVMGKTAKDIVDVTRERLTNPDKYPKKKPVGETNCKFNVAKKNEMKTNNKNQNYKAIAMLPNGDEIINNYSYNSRTATVDNNNNSNAVSVDNESNNNRCGCVIL